MNYRQRSCLTCPASLPCRLPLPRTNLHTFHLRRPRCTGIGANADMHGTRHAGMHMQPSRYNPEGDLRYTALTQARGGATGLAMPTNGFLRDAT